MDLGVETETKDEEIKLKPKLLEKKFPLSTSMLKKVKVDTNYRTIARYMDSLQDHSKKGIVDAIGNIAKNASKAEIKCEELYKTAKEECVRRGHIPGIWKVIEAASEVGITLQITDDDYKTILNTKAMQNLDNFWRFVELMKVHRTKNPEVYIAALDRFIEKECPGPALDLLDIAMGEGLENDPFFSKAIGFFDSIASYRKVVCRIEEYLIEVTSKKESSDLGGESCQD